MLKRILSPEERELENAERAGYILGLISFFIGILGIVLAISLKIQDFRPLIAVLGIVLTVTIAIALIRRREKREEFKTFDLENTHRELIDNLKQDLKKAEAELNLNISDKRVRDGG
jgi:uncharacterized membrane protein